METATKQHIFTDLGQAPYKLLGYRMAESYDSEHGETFGGLQADGGTGCSHCGQYIVHIFQCQSSDGKKFVLGSTCVEKLGDEGLTRAVKTKMSELRREKREAKALAEWEAGAPEREKARLEREAEEAERAAKFESEYNLIKPVLERRPHPNAYFASKGKTLLDYVEYCGPKRFTGLRIIREAGGNV